MNRSLVAALALAAGLLWGPAWSRAADMEITVTTSDGKPFKGVVYAGEQMLSVESGKEKLLVRNLAAERHAVTADLKVAQAPGKPDLRYIGVTEGFPAKTGVKKVTIKAQPVKDIEVYCKSCHPSTGEPIKRGQIIRDIHVSGKELVPPYLTQTENFKMYIDGVRKAGKERAPEPIVLEERVVIVKGKEIKKYFYNCESCHTLHWKLPWTKYCRASALERGILCAGCHI